MAQRYYGIDTRSTVCWNKACSQCNESQQDSDAYECDRIRSTDTYKLITDSGGTDVRT